MGEEVVRRDEERVHEWEDGLPDQNDLTPLSYVLFSPNLASAFSITPEASRTMLDVNRASQITLSSLRKVSSSFTSLPSFQNRSLGKESKDPIIVEEDNENEFENFKKDGSSEKRKSDNTSAEEPDEDDQTAKALKRTRLVWTPQLHKRFVDVVAHLGIKTAVPKTIMQLMNVEGLTRENVASHLQKYRLYLKRMQGLSNEGPSPSDKLFASTPVPSSLKESGGGAAAAAAAAQSPVAVQYSHHPLMPMPVLAHHMGRPIGNLPPGFVDPHQYQYNMYREQQRDWSGNNFGSIVSHHHISPHTK